MSEISSIAPTIMALKQSQIKDELAMSILKMNAQAEAALADMLTENARQIIALSGASENIIDVFV